MRSLLGSLPRSTGRGNCADVTINISTNVNVAGKLTWRSSEGGKLSKPGWMKKLEEKYQRLHNKIAALPKYPPATSRRINLLTRRILSQNSSNANLQGSKRNSHKNTRRKDFNGNGNEDSLQISEIGYQPSTLNTGDDISGEPNDENCPLGGAIARKDPVLPVLNAASREFVHLSDCGCASHCQCQAQGTCSPRDNPTPASRASLPSSDSRAGSQSNGHLLPLETCADQKQTLSPPSLALGGDSLDADSPSQVLSRTAGVSHCSRLSAPPCSAVHPGCCIVRRHPFFPDVLNPELSAITGREGNSFGCCAEAVAKKNGWASVKMVDASLRTLTTASNEAENKHGIRFGNHMTAAKTWPSALASLDVPCAPYHCRRSGGREASGTMVGPQPMRVFAQMSVEARLAVTETLREMGVPAPKSKDKRTEDAEEDDSHSISSLVNAASPGLCSSPRRGRHKHHRKTTTSTFQTNTGRSSKPAARQQQEDCQNDHADITSRRIGGSWRRNDRNPPFSYNSVRTDEALVETHEDDVNVELLSLSSDGIGPSCRPSTEIRHQYTRFPVITSRTEPNLSMLQQTDAGYVNYRIRGVGSYRVAREATFEITAPDFDVRYRDAITCQKEGRETPPLEIFEKSVEKVRDWLNRYYAPS